MPVIASIEQSGKSAQPTNLLSKAKHVISAEHLCKIYESNSNSIRALDDLSLQIDSGQKVAIVGRSGSGKTTLLNMLSGLDRPTSGRLVVDGFDLSKVDSAQVAKYRMNSIGVIFQSFQLIPQRSAAENIELPLIIAGIPPAQRKQAVSQAIAEVGLKHRSNHFPFQLSGGEQQRVAIGRALVKQPAVLLADEPTGNLDSKTANEIMELVTRVSDEHSLTLVLISHDQELAKAYTQRQLTMDDGTLTEQSYGNTEKAASK